MRSQTLSRNRVIERWDKPSPPKDIIRTVTVDRTRSLEKAFEASGLKKVYARDVDLNRAPVPRKAVVEVVFFRPRTETGILRLSEVPFEYAIRGLRPADPYTLAALYEAEPTFAFEHPHRTFWRARASFRAITVLQFSFGMRYGVQMEVCCEDPATGACVASIDQIEDRSDPLYDDTHLYSMNWRRESWHYAGIRTFLSRIFY